MEDSHQIDISIVVPAYNVEKYLDEFFVCLLAQTYQGFKVVMVDDQSTDATFEKAKQRGGALGDRFILLQNPTNLGPGPTRNTALEEIEKNPTTYLTFLDADDWFEPEYLEDLHSAAVSSNSDLTIAGIVRFEEGTNHILATEMVNYSSEVFNDSSKCDDLAFINTCLYAKLFNYQSVSDARFKNMLRSEDTCFLFDALPTLKTVKFTNKALYHYRVSEESLSKTFSTKTYESIHAGFESEIPKFSQDLYVPYREMFETQVFIRSSVGSVLRMAANKANSANVLAKAELRWLDQSMPTWRTNKYLSGGQWKSRNKKQLALKVAARLYKCHCFALLVYVYSFVSNVLKKEVRA